MKDGSIQTDFPFEGHDEVEPVYEELPGWNTKTAGSRNTINCRKTCSTIWPASRNWWRLLHRSSPPVPNGRIRLCFNPTGSGSHESDPQPGFSGSALFAYYAGYREWGTDVLLGWLDNTGFSEFILESGSGLWGWVQDQELGDQVEQGLDRVKDAVSQ